MISFIVKIISMNKEIKESAWNGC